MRIHQIGYFAQLAFGYYSDLLPQANENLQVFALPMGHGEGTIIMCPKLADGSGGEISIYDLGTIVKVLITAFMKAYGQDFRYR